MGTPSLSGTEGTILGLESELERLIALDVPVYGAAEFHAAVGRVEVARGQVVDRTSEEEFRAATQAAATALHEAETRAEILKPHLSRLVQTRTLLIRNEVVGYRAPELLQRADDLYEAALKSAASQDIERAVELAAEAVTAFAEVSLACLERGPLRRLADDLDGARGAISASDFDEAESVRGALKAAARDVRSGDLSVPAFRRQVTRATARIGALIGPGPQTGTDPHVPPAAPGGGWAPGTDGPPDRVRSIRVGTREARSLAIRWKDPEGVFDIQVLERSIEDGPFQVVEQFGHAINGWSGFVDTGLNPDTLHRYRVTVQNEFGASTTFNDDIAAGYTRTTEDLPVWRVQVRIRVADVPDGGSTDGLQIRLQSPLFSHAPNGNRTWLDHAPRRSNAWPQTWQRNLDRGTEFTYDVNLDYVRQLGDITMLTMKKQGTDALAVAEVALIVNGSNVFRKFFGDSASTCLWLDGDDGHTPMYTIYHPELRASSLWQTYVQAPAALQRVFPNDEIVSRFEAAISDLIHGTPAEWKATPLPLRVTRAPVKGQPYERLNVDIRLKADVGFLPDPNISMRITLAVHVDCNAAGTEATLVMESTEVHASADFDALVDVLLLAAAPAGIALLAFGKVIAAKAALSQWQDVVERVVLSTPGSCPTLQVDQDADGDASIQFRPR